MFRKCELKIGEAKVEGVKGVKRKPSPAPPRRGKVIGENIKYFKFRKYSTY